MSEEVKDILKYLKKKENTRRIKCITISEAEILLDYIQQKENIIKEVREYIEEWQRFPHTNGSTHKELKNLIDILEKENK